MFCKTIILSNSSNLNSNAPKGILTLSSSDNGIIGKIRLYNLATLPINTKIGIYSNNEVYTSHIIKKLHHFEFSLQENLDLTKSLYCALIDNTAGDKQVVLEGGNFNGFYFSDSPFDAVLEAKDDELDKTIDEALNICNNHCQDCEDCEYKKYFYENTSPTPGIKLNDDTSPIKESTETLENIADMPNSITLSQEIEQDSKTLTQSNENMEKVGSTLIETQNKSEHIKQEFEQDFLTDIIYQLDEMFARYPEDELLNSIIPNSRFIRVEADNVYVLGMLYEDKMLKYIAYGVPAEYNSNPPADLGKHYQWLPLNPNDPLSDGYFMIYQDAKNGTIIQMEFEEK